VTDGILGHSERMDHERRATERDSESTDRLGRIADELTALRSDLGTFMRAQLAVNAEFREHVIRSTVTGEVHAGDWAQMKKNVADQDERLEDVESWKTQMLTIGTLLKLTFGASVFGVVIGIVGLVNIVVGFGK